MGHPEVVMIVVVVVLVVLLVVVLAVVIVDTPYRLLFETVGSCAPAAVQHY
jgi:hypothetical protein